MCKGFCRFLGDSGNVAGRCASALATSCVLAAVAFGETLPVSADTYTTSNAPTSNFGSDPTVRLRSGSHAGYLFFDLESLDSGEVLGATLRIHVQGVAGGANIAVHEVLGPWGEGGLTHQTAPPLNLIPTAESLVTPGDVGDFLAVDVTALVNAWVANPSSNFGLSLQSRTSGIAIRFSSREAGFSAELEVERAEKPNFARVEVEGGDYSNPIDAMNDSDSWCDVSSLSLTDSCQLFIGPGIFLLAESLNLPDKFDVLGAGNSGSQRTELVAQPDVETVIQLVGTEFGEQGRNVISDLRVRNSEGANGKVGGIGSVNSGEDGSDATIRNVSVDVSGGVADVTTGISVGTPELRNVDVSVNGGLAAVGIVTSCADAADVRVRVTAINAQPSIGWRESSDCGPPIVRFDVSVIGPNSVGMDFDTMDSAQLAEGIVAANGIGIIISGQAHLQNLRVTASTGIQLLFSDPALLDNIDVEASETALDVGSQAFSARVTDSTLFGETGVRVGSESTSLSVISCL